MAGSETNKRLTFLNPVLSIPWGYRADAGNLRELRHLHAAAGIFCLDKRTGALDLRLIKPHECSNCKRPTTNINNNNDYSGGISSQSTITNSDSQQSTITQSSEKSLISKVVENCKTTQGRSRRKSTKPQKRVACENTDPLEDYIFDDYKKLVKFYNLRPKPIRPKVGVILKLRNKQYESKLL